MHGEGRMTTARGDVCVGSWKDNKMDGAFVINYASGVVYDGLMLNDVPHGVGKLTSANKLFHYEGEFVKGAKEGEGTMHWGDDRRYVGQWRANSMHGNGASLLSLGRRALTHHCSQAR